MFYFLNYEKRTNVEKCKFIVKRVKIQKDFITRNFCLRNALKRNSKCYIVFYILIFNNFVSERWY